jgi:hypothetical protein
LNSSIFLSLSKLCSPHNAKYLGKRKDQPPELIQQDNWSRRRDENDLSVHMILGQKNKKINDAMRGKSTKRLILFSLFLHIHTANVWITLGAHQTRLQPCTTLANTIRQWFRRQQLPRVQYVLDCCLVQPFYPFHHQRR